MSEERRKAEEFAAELGRIYSDSLVAVVLYGSAARGQFRQGISDLNLLVILDELELAHLRRSAKLIREWVASGNPPPLMMSAAEWWGSADVFPLEYSDIRDAHVLLAGRDPFTEMRIVREHLRLQLEHELRSKKIQLREAFLVSGENPEEIGQLLIRSISTFLTLFRAILRLDGADVPKSAPEVIERVGSRVGFDAAAMLEVLSARQEGGDFAPALDAPVTAGYLAAVERSVEWLDDAELRSDLGEEV